MSTSLRTERSLEGSSTPELDLKIDLLVGAGSRPVTLAKAIQQIQACVSSGREFILSGEEPKEELTVWIFQNGKAHRVGDFEYRSWAEDAVDEYRCENVPVIMTPTKWGKPKFAAREE